jgi:hypothetical protein
MLELSVHLARVCRGAHHARGRKQPLAEVILPLHTARRLDRAAGEREVDVGIADGVRDRGVLQQSEVDLVGDLTGVCVTVHDRPALEAVPVAQQVAQGERRGQVLRGQRELRKHLLQRAVELELPFACQHADRHRRIRLGRRGDVVAGVGRGGLAGRVAHTERIQRKHRAVLHDGDGEAGHVECLEGRSPSRTQALQLGHVLECRSGDHHG